MLLRDSLNFPCKLYCSSLNDAPLCVLQMEKLSQLWKCRTATIRVLETFCYIKSTRVHYNCLPQIWERQRTLYSQSLSHKNFSPSISADEQKHFIEPNDIYSLDRMVIWSIYGNIDSSFERINTILNFNVLFRTFSNYSMWLFGFKQKIWFHET